jgi:hypothetical protein
MRTANGVVFCVIPLTYLVRRKPCV